MLTRFNNPRVTPQSWYVAVRSGAVRRGRVRSLELLNRKIAVYRDTAGTLHALDARCPHLGADLGHAAVVGDAVRCAFHHWCWGPDGVCRSAPMYPKAPSRRARSYPVIERWGLIWLFNGPKPLFELPAPPQRETMYVLRLPQQTIRCHPHLVVANGLDVSHLSALHGLELTSDPKFSQPSKHELKLTIQGHPRSKILRSLTGTLHHDFLVEFSTIGPNLAWLAVQAPLRFYVLFTGRATPKGHCQTQTLLFFPRRAWLRLGQIIAFLYAVLYDDHRILNDLEFFPGFGEHDAPLKLFVERVETMEVW